MVDDTHDPGGAGRSLTHGYHGEQHQQRTGGREPNEPTDLSSALPGSEQRASARADNERHTDTGPRLVRFARSNWGPEQAHAGNTQ